MGKKSGSGVGKNNPDHISESLETICWVKMLKFFVADMGWKKLGSGMEKIQIRNPGWNNSDRNGKNSDPRWEKFGIEIRGWGKVQIRVKHPGYAILH
jgi:hypothetical protein